MRIRTVPSNTDIMITMSIANKGSGSGRMQSPSVHLPSVLYVCTNPQKTYALQHNEAYVSFVQSVQKSAAARKPRPLRSAPAVPAPVIIAAFEEVAAGAPELVPDGDVEDGFAAEPLEVPVEFEPEDVVLVLLAVCWKVLNVLFAVGLMAKTMPF